MSLSIWRLESGTANKCARWLLIASFRRIGIAPQWMQPPSSNQGRNGSWVGPMQRSILQYMVWPAFTPSDKKGEKKEPKSPKPWQNQYQWQSQGRPPYMGQQPPPGMGMGPYPLLPPQSYGNPQASFGQPRYCNFCYTWGHSEEKCFAKKAALKGSTKS